MHLVLRVHTDDALRITTTTTSEQLREALKNASVSVGSITVQSPTAFRVEGVPQDKDAEFRSLADQEAGTSYERSSGVGGSYDFKMKANIERNLREQTVVQALDTIDRRVNELGVTEPTIARQSNAEQLIVQMPGLTDVARAKEIIRSTALLEFRLVEAGPATKEDLLKQYNGNLPGDMEMLPGSGTEGAGLFYVVKKIAPVTGQDLRVAKPGLDENNQPAVRFTLSAEGGRKFGTLTEQNIGRALAIILDGRVQSAPRLESRITTDGRITGSFTQQDTMCDSTTTIDDLDDINACTPVGTPEEGDVPPVLPVVKLLLGLRFKIVDQLSLNIEAGWRFPAFFVGGGIGYFF